MRLAYAMVKFSVNNGKSLPVTVPTVARVQRHDLAAIADPNVRVETARCAVTIIRCRPADGWHLAQPEPDF
jgi:hypothetical protein